MTSLPISGKYPVEMSTSSSRLPHSRRRTLSQQKVNGWLKSTSTSSLSPLSSSSPPDGKKKVRWNKDVEDNEKAPRRSYKTAASKSGSTSKSSPTKNSSSASSSPCSSPFHSKRKPYPSSSKDDYSFRAPPPTPRIPRQPTPDLSDVEHGDFCYCCPSREQAKNAEQKMNDLLDAAMAHITAANQLGR